MYTTWGADRQWYAGWQPVDALASAGVCLQAKLCIHRRQCWSVSRQTKLCDYRICTPIIGLTGLCRCAYRDRTLAAQDSCNGPNRLPFRSGVPTDR
ncbi:hypothetical protein XHC_0384 [Xanthomonas hortorum pv. carotae str. M081]|nr:hypothetical protein XHC_0384 [Xanthomonas hortorum pv. carotae str. M081]